jgi:hypothetical protein
LAKKMMRQPYDQLMISGVEARREFGAFRQMPVAPLDDSGNWLPSSGTILRPATAAVNGDA